MIAALLLTAQVAGGGLLSGVNASVVITSPTSNSTYDNGSNTSVSLGGTAASDRGVQTVTWTCSTCTPTSGTAAGTTSWTIASVTVASGTNTFIITVTDTAGTTGTDTLVVTASSGCTSTLAAGTTAAQVNTAYGSASDGAVLCFSAGSYTWGNGTVVTFSSTKGVTLKCVTVGACNVTWVGRVYTLPSASSSKLYRISGFNWTSSSGTQMFYACPGGSCGRVVLEQFRFDNNTVTFAGNEQLFQSDQASSTYLYGVIDHNTFSVTTQSATKIDWPNTLDSVSPVTGRLGASTNLFVEDNVWTITTNTTGAVPCLDGWGTALGTVWRFNTITNCRLALHGVSHSYGPSNWEVYGNDFTLNSTYSSNLLDGFRTIHHQGSGTYGVWGNRIAQFTTHSGSAIVVLHYRSFEPNGAPSCDGTNAVDGNRSPTATYRGYPCKHQAGRDTDATAYPAFAFTNTWNDDSSMINLVLNGGGGPTPDYSTTHLVSNRDYFNAVSASAQTSPSSPFDGTTGIGYGTLANRPATCTTGTEAADTGRVGVMYWATDQGSWNASTTNPRGMQQSGADGVLYICSATDTWTVYYTPYTYPHPLNN